MGIIKQRLGDVMKTNAEIWEMLNQTMVELGVTLEQARAINAIRILIEEMDEQRQDRKAMQAKVGDLMKLVRDYLNAETDGEIHGASQKQAVLKKHGLKR